MKTKKILSIAIFFGMLLLSRETDAQIYMNHDGDVNIGAQWNYPCKFRVVGWTNVRGSFTIGGNYYSNLGMSVEGGAYFLTGVGNNYGVGIGISPDVVNTLKVSGGSESGYAIRAYGNSYSTGSWITSDKRFKKNFKPLTGTLEKIQKLNGQMYEFKNSKELEGLNLNNAVDTAYKFDSNGKKIATLVPRNGYVFPKGEQIGLLAQEVIEIFPELAKLDSADNTYSINYDGFIPLLIEAIKEQQAIIEKYETRISALENNGKRNKSTEEITGEVIEQYNQPYLEQNAPNPFSVSTTINYFIPQGSQKAAIYIYDMQGLQKKAYHIYTKGKSSITISGSELPAGIYFYSLIADGKEVDTKRMILTN